jgi:threonine/homoserine/homoserine lactone efflux protein
VRTLLHRRSAGTGLLESQFPAGRATGLRQGFVVGANSPKTTVFFLAILPQFVERGGFSPILPMLLLGLVWTGIALVSDSARGLAAVRAKGWLVRSPRRAEMASAASGVVMVGLAVGLAVTGSRN